MTTNQPELVPGLQHIPALLAALGANADPTAAYLRLRDAWGPLTPSDIERDIRERLRRDAFQEAADLIEFTWGDYADSDTIRAARKFARTLRQEVGA